MCFRVRIFPRVSKKRSIDAGCKTLYLLKIFYFYALLRFDILALKFLISQVVPSIDWRMHYLSELSVEKRNILFYIYDAIIVHIYYKESSNFFACFFIWCFIQSLFKTKSYLAILVELSGPFLSLAIGLKNTGLDQKTIRFFNFLS